MKSLFNVNIKTTYTERINQLSTKSKTDFYSSNFEKLNFLKVINFVCFFLFSLSSLMAQEIQTSSLEETILVKGTVSDDTSPLQYVNVHLEGTEIGTTTNSNGYFQFPQKLKKGDVLIFSFVGLKSQKIVVNNENSASKIELKVDMELDEIIIMGKVSEKKIYKSKRS